MDEIVIIGCREKRLSFMEAILSLPWLVVILVYYISVWLMSFITQGQKRDTGRFMDSPRHPTHLAVEDESFKVVHLAGFDLLRDEPRATIWELAPLHKFLCRTRHL